MAENIQKETYFEPQKGDKNFLRLSPGPELAEAFQSLRQECNRDDSYLFADLALAHWSLMIND